MTDAISSIILSTHQHKKMNRYQLQEEIGDGTFGRVIKAKNKETDEIVAIKHIKSKFKVSRE